MVKKRRKTSKHQNKCAWCGALISDEDEVFALSAIANPFYKKQLKRREGQILPIHLVLTEKVVDAIVVAEDSQAKSEGYDFIFMLCSEACAMNLKEALLQEKTLIQKISDSKSLPNT
jgi:hypothetical protein